MMKADVTAENKPAYFQRGVHTNVEIYGGNAHKYQRAIQIFVVFLDEIVVVIVRRALEFIVELDGGVVGRPEAWKECRQCFEYGILHAGDDGKKDDWNGADTEGERLVWRTLLGRWSLPPLWATRNRGSCSTGYETQNESAWKGEGCQCATWSLYGLHVTMP